MRLSPEERHAIVEEIRRKAADAVIYLYGSRVDDRLRGGDIDLLVMTSEAEWPDKIDMLLAIKQRIGEQKIDLKLLRPEEAKKDTFVQAVLPGAVRLEN